MLICHCLPPLKRGFCPPIHHSAIVLLACSSPSLQIALLQLCEMNGWLSAEAEFAWGNEMDRALVPFSHFPHISYIRRFCICITRQRTAFPSCLLSSSLFSISPLCFASDRVSHYTIHPPYSIPTACLSSFVSWLACPSKSLARNNC